MEQIKKTKIVWICHFSNSKVRHKLPLSNLIIQNFFRRILHKKTYVIHKDFAPWINNLINEFENFYDIELHIISPHKGLKRFTSEFEINGIHYHFFKAELPFFLRIIQEVIFKSKPKKFLLNRYIGKRFIKSISPDLINLIGTENPYYSAISLDIKSIPIYVSLQTIFSNPDRKIHSIDYDQIRWDTELKILKKEKYFGCIGGIHRDLALKQNPQAILFKNFFPIEKPKNIKKVPKKYDFVFFASTVSPKKGIEDALEALFIVKHIKPDVSLNIVGRCPHDYQPKLLNLIEEKKLSENIIFNEYFPIHSDMHQHIMKSRFALLPVKLDVIPGTIIEAMMLGIPVVAYKTSGTPYLNKEIETVLLADIGDIRTLSTFMLRLLESKELAISLSSNAKMFAEKEFDNYILARRIALNYKAIIDHYYNNKEIPKELLLNNQEF